MIEKSTLTQFFQLLFRRRWGRGLDHRPPLRLARDAWCNSHGFWRGRIASTCLSSHFLPPVDVGFGGGLAGGLMTAPFVAMTGAGFPPLFDPLVIYVLLVWKCVPAVDLPALWSQMLRPIRRR